MTNLYEIQKGIDSLLLEAEQFEQEEKVEGENGELPYFDIRGKFEALQMSLKEKYDNIGRYIKNEESDIAGIKVEIDRLTALKKSKESKVERLKGLLTRSMDRNGIENMETGTFKFSFRKSEAVIIANELLIPDEYKTQKLEIKIDKDLIKKHLKMGVVIEGVNLETRQNLQIK